MSTLLGASEPGVELWGLLPTADSAEVEREPWPSRGLEVNASGSPKP